jgi:response regulator RpfG family c-di-GMP phosphodiesterase
MARILIVDSDPKTRLHINNLLSTSGHQLLEAETGIEGIRLATVHQPDLILLEVNLSDLDGYEVTLRLRGMPLLKPVPILILAPQPDRQTTLAVGANSTIQTPLDAAAFQRKIEHYLRGFRDMAEGTGEHRLREQSWRIVERLEKKVVELSDANKRMQDMMRLRREFLQNVSHELATPMTPVMGYLRLLLGGDMGPLSPMQEKSLHAVEASVRRLRSIIDALLDVSSLET